MHMHNVAQKTKSISRRKYYTLTDIERIAFYHFVIWRKYILPVVDTYLNTC